MPGLAAVLANPAIITPGWQPGGPSVQVKNRSIVPNTALMLLAPGTRVFVSHDPADPQQLLVAWDEVTDSERPDPRGTGG